MDVKIALYLLFGLALFGLADAQDYKWTPFTNTGDNEGMSTLFGAIAACLVFLAIVYFAASKKNPQQPA